MYRILSNLISKKYYATKEEAMAKVDVAFAMNKITQDQYSSLVILVNENYPEVESNVTE